MSLIKRFDERAVASAEALARNRERKAKAIKRSMMRPLYQEVLRVLFISACLLPDFLIPLEFALYGTVVGWILFAITLGGLLAVEGFIYSSIWGPGGRWDVEDKKEGE